MKQTTRMRVAIFFIHLLMSLNPLQAHRTALEERTFELEEDAMQKVKDASMASTEVQATWDFLPWIVFPVFGVPGLAAQSVAAHILKQHGVHISDPIGDIIRHFAPLPDDCESLKAEWIQILAKLEEEFVEDADGKISGSEATERLHLAMRAFRISMRAQSEKLQCDFPDSSEEQRLKKTLTVLSQQSPCIAQVLQRLEQNPGSFNLWDVININCSEEEASVNAGDDANALDEKVIAEKVVLMDEMVNTGLAAASDSSNGGSLLQQELTSHHANPVLLAAPVLSKAFFVPVAAAAPAAATPPGLAIFIVVVVVVVLWMLYNAARSQGRRGRYMLLEVQNEQRNSTRISHEDGNCGVADKFVLTSLAFACKASQLHSMLAHDDQSAWKSCLAQNRTCGLCFC